MWLPVGLAAGATPSRLSSSRQCDTGSSAWLSGIPEKQRRVSPRSHYRQAAERMLRVQEALNGLDPIDRKMLALRHFEQLGRAEAALVLGISQEAGAKRYFRALKRLKDVLAMLPGGGEAF